MDITLVGLALADQIAEIDPELSAFSWNPDSITAPTVFPKEWEVDFTDPELPLGGGGYWTVFTVWILVGRADDQTGQTTIQDYAGAAREAVYADTTLDGNAVDAFVTGVRAPGKQEYAGTEYLLLELTVRVYG